MAGETIQLLFGKGHLPVNLPEGAKATIIRKGVLPKLSDDRRPSAKP